ncbi:MAG: ABC transporter permease [Clostridium sp.]|nr:ABC transporter permease [Clostridium sp.]
MNRKRKTKIIIYFIFIFLLVITISGIFLPEKLLEADFKSKNLKPSLSHLFGTDWMGRDMFFRTLKGLSISILIGLLASSISAVIAGIIGVMSGTLPKWVDNTVLFLIDLFMGIPHILLLILISFATGRGIKGIIIGVSITHWTGLARVIRAETLQIKNEFYIKTAKNFGKSNLYIMRHHIMPHIIPQFIVGLILLFPHAILHEASITFLGFGLSPEDPAIGIILSESMKYLSSGMWWLAFFPGLSLVFVVILFDKLGENIKRLMDPYSSQE